MKKTFLLLTFIIFSNCFLSIGQETKVTITTTTETKTGASLPIAIVAIGVVGATVIYATTKKNKKLYKI